jgi:hypothetical protein
LIFPAVHRPNGQRPSLRPPRPVGNAELYRSGVSGSRCQTRVEHRSGISRLDREGCELLPMPAALPWRLMGSEWLDDGFALNSSDPFEKYCRAAPAERMRDRSTGCKSHISALNVGMDALKSARSSLAVLALPAPMPRPWSIH